MYAQDANGNVVATTLVPVPLPILDDGDYAPVVSDYVGLPFLGAWDGGYYHTGYYNAHWDHAGYYNGPYNRNGNNYRGGTQLGESDSTGTEYRRRSGAWITRWRCRAQ